MKLETFNLKKFKSAEALEKHPCVLLFIVCIGSLWTYFVKLLYTTKFWKIWLILVYIICYSRLLPSPANWCSIVWVDLRSCWTSLKICLRYWPLTSLGFLWRYCSVSQRGWRTVLLSLFSLTECVVRLKDERTFTQEEEDKLQKVLSLGSAAELQLVIETCEFIFHQVTMSSDNFLIRMCLSSFIHLFRLFL